MARNHIQTTVKNNFIDSLQINQITYIDYFNRVAELALACFKWENLPNTVDPRFLEFALLRDGRAVFFKDEALKEYLCLFCVGGGALDVYGIPKQRTAYGLNNYQYPNLNEDNSVIIYNNKLHTNLTIDLLDFARRLYDIDRTIDINVRAQKTPVLITGEEKQMLGLKNLYKKYEGNEPVIYGDKHQINGEVFQVLKTDAPFISKELYELKTNIWNEALTYLGISNISYQKQERLLTDEVNRGLGGTIMNRNIRLSERKEACKRINEMFNLNIDVKFNEEYNNIAITSENFNDEFYS